MGKSQAREWLKSLKREGRSGDEVPEDAGGRRGLELVQRGAF